jgi:hypothetical protein
MTDKKSKKKVVKSKKVIKLKTTKKNKDGSYNNTNHVHIVVGDTKPKTTRKYTKKAGTVKGGHVPPDYSGQAQIISSSQQSIPYTAEEARRNSEYAINYNKPTLAIKDRDRPLAIKDSEHSQKDLLTITNNYLTTNNLKLDSNYRVTEVDDELDNSDKINNRLLLKDLDKDELIEVIAETNKIVKKKLTPEERKQIAINNLGKTEKHIMKKLDTEMNKVLEEKKDIADAFFKEKQDARISKRKDDISLQKKGLKIFARHTLEDKIKREDEEAKNDHNVEVELTKIYKPKEILKESNNPLNNFKSSKITTANINKNIEKVTEPTINDQILSKNVEKLQAPSIPIVSEISKTKKSITQKMTSKMNKLISPPAKLKENKETTGNINEAI